MGSEEATIFFVAAVHLAGAIVLVWLLVSSSAERPDPLGWWRGDDDDPGPEPVPPPAPARPSGGIPLPDAVPSPVRLRGPQRLADGHEAPGRRPAHVPARPTAPRVRPGADPPADPR